MQRKAAITERPHSHGAVMIDGLSFRLTDSPGNWELVEAVGLGTGVAVGWACWKACEIEPEDSHRTYSAKRRAEIEQVRE